MKYRFRIVLGGAVIATASFERCGRQTDDIAGVVERCGFGQLGSGSASGLASTSTGTISRRSATFDVIGVVSVVAGEDGSVAAIGIAAGRLT